LVLSSELRLYFWVKLNKTVDFEAVFSK
jgi:hypothetical protein